MGQDENRMGALMGGQLVRWYAGIILERSGPISKGGHSSYCGEKCSLDCTSLPPKTLY